LKHGVRFKQDEISPLITAFNRNPLVRVRLARLANGALDRLGQNFRRRVRRENRSRSRLIRCQRQGVIIGLHPGEPGQVIKWRKLSTWTQYLQDGVYHDSGRWNRLGRQHNGQPGGHEERLQRPELIGSADEEQNWKSHGISPYLMMYRNYKPIPVDIRIYLGMIAIYPTRLPNKMALEFVK